MFDSALNLHFYATARLCLHCREAKETSMANAVPAPTWAHVDLNTCPSITVPPPGPNSQTLHQRCAKHFKGLSSQVKLFPVAFESGYGCTLK